MTTFLLLLLLLLTTVHSQLSGMSLSSDPPSMEEANQHLPTQPVDIKHVAIGDSIDITWTPAIAVNKKMCIEPYLEELSVPGSKASPSEVEIVETADHPICFDVQTMDYEKEESDEYVTTKGSKSYEMKMKRKVRINVKEAASGKSYVVKAAVVMDDMKSGVSDDASPDDYDVARMTEYLSHGVAFFTVNRKGEMTPEFVEDNRVNRIESGEVGGGVQ